MHISGGSEYYFFSCFRTMSSATACAFYRQLHGHHRGELVPWTAPVSNSPVESELQGLSFRTMDSANDSPVHSMMWNW